MHILWIGSKAKEVSHLMSYLTNNDSYDISFVDEKSVSSQLEKSDKAVNAVVYETSLENVSFDTDISSIRGRLGARVPVVAKFKESLSSDLRDYFTCKFDDILLSEDSFRDCELKLEQASSKLGSVKRVLVMEDDLDLADMIVNMLTNDRVEVYHASKGYDAILMCQKYHFDLLITDLIVEGINGFELVNYVNSSHLQKKPEIIIMSGAFEGELEKKVEQLDVKNVFDKPFNVQSFQNRVNGLLYS
jgi:CheY-like chemotaxis protein